MKKALTLLSILFLTAPAFTYETININAKKEKSYNEKKNEQAELLASKRLVHLVLIKFKKDILPDDFQKIIKNRVLLFEIQH